MAAQQKTGGSGHQIFYRVRNVEHAGISEVLPGLYVSGICALRPSIMKEYGITLIINATREVPNSSSLGKMPRMKLWLEDTPDAWVLSYLDYICNKILKTVAKGGKVLIHSVQGVSRCATICLAFLTKYKFKTLRGAYMHLASVRPKVEPNIGFWRQLISFEQELKQHEGSVRIVRGYDDPSILVPDVYQQLLLHRRKLRQIQQQAEATVNNNVDSVKAASVTADSRKPPPTNPMDKENNNNIEQVDLAAAASGTVAAATALTMVATAAATAATVNADAAVTASETATELSLRSQQPQAWSLKSHTPGRRNSLSKKFFPVLEPLTEVLEVAAA